MTVELVPPGFMELDGVDDAAVTADKAGLDITGDIETIALIRPSSLSTLQTILGKWAAAGDKAYRFGLNASGGLRLQISTNGSGQFTVDSTVPIPIVANETIWVRVLYDQLSGNVDFFTADDPLDTHHTSVVWVPLGTTVDSGNTSLLNVSGLDLRVGTNSDGSEPFSDRIHGAWLYGDEGVSGGFSDDFVGNNGDPWDAGKWPEFVLSGPDANGVADIQSNEGRLFHATGSDARTMAIAGAASSHTDAELLTDLRRSNNAASHTYVWLRASGDTVDAGPNAYKPTDGIGVRIIANSNVVEIITVVNGTENVIDAKSIGHQNTNQQRLRMRIEGPVLSFSLWETSGGEPPFPEMTANDGGVVSGPGVLQLAVRRSSQTTVEGIFFDNLNLEFL